jgi:C4-type Zn-finger protein
MPPKRPVEFEYRVERPLHDANPMETFKAQGRAPHIRPVQQNSTISSKCAFRFASAALRRGEGSRQDRETRHQVMLCEKIGFIFGG